MGSSSSKVSTVTSRSGAGRKFPTRAPNSSIPPRLPLLRATPSPTSLDPASSDHGKGQSAGTQTGSIPGQSQANTNSCESIAIRANPGNPQFASDSTFSERLHRMGVVLPNPGSRSSRIANASPGGDHTAPFFPTTSRNTTLSALAARRALQDVADQELEKMGSRGFHGRRFLDIRSIVDAMRMCDRGVPQSEIEKRLKLQPGVLSRLGYPTFLTNAAS
ncbi:hypothetical protein DCS_07337 [Drechmeria coniospora]|uniref:Helix-turn-helix domain-containing protein n=1 Tax=Drechmeria coniospora TaxID=98403 RepID=A0A151GE54_DRECN|nr:hypothetical protein DCS_07337 [Drechmeria coniospora]KYK55374.1 hypothetical protein DCS_07337 [Drechmeria coniospora]